MKLFDFLFHKRKVNTALHSINYYFRRQRITIKAGKCKIPKGYNHAIFNIGKDLSGNSIYIQSVDYKSIEKFGIKTVYVVI